MTEQEWLACRDPNPLVAAVLIPEQRPPGLQVRQAGLRRKLRQFCCACCRRVEHLLTEPDLRALLLAEDFAEKPGTYRLDRRPDYHVPSGAVSMAVEGYAIVVPHNVLSHVAEEARRLSRPLEEAFAQEKAAQAALFHDVFGNLFRPPPAPDPAWLAWERRTVPKLAQAIYDERAFERVPVLADALEDAGCSDEVILSHLRSAGPHVRGCWAVDLILGK